MQKPMRMMRQERRFRLLFWGLLAAVFLLFAAGMSAWAYHTHGPLQGVPRIEGAADAERADQGRMWGMGLTVPEGGEALDDFVLVSNGVEETYHVSLFRQADYALLLMSKGEISAGQECTVGVDHPEQQETLRAAYQERVGDLPLYIFYDDAPNFWIYTGIFAGLGGLFWLIYLHFHGKRYLLRHTRFGREISALEEPREALREMGREMKKPLLRTSNMTLTPHWVLYRRYEEEEKRWHLCPVEKARVISHTLTYLEGNPEDEYYEGPRYQWTLNETARQHRILLDDPQEVQAAEAYFQSTMYTGEAR